MPRPYKKPDAAFLSENGRDDDLDDPLRQRRGGGGVHPAGAPLSSRTNQLHGVSQWRSQRAEVEARNTQKRAGMTDEQRRASLASSTEDVSRSRQLIFDEKGNRINTSPSMTKEPSKVFGLPAEVYEQRMKDVLTNQPELRQVPYGVDSEYIRSLSYDDYIKMLNHSDKDYGKMLKEHPDKNSIDNALELWRERNPGKNPEMSRPIMSEEEAKYLVEKGGSLKGYNLRHTNPNRPKGGSKKGGPGRPRGPEWFREEMEQTLEKELLQNK